VDDSVRPFETPGRAEDDPALTSYREAHYRFLWGTEKHSLLLLEPKLLRCVRRDRYAPYVFDYLVTSESGRTRAYSTDGMREELVRYGEHYLDPRFMSQLRADYASFAESFRRFLLGLNSTGWSTLSNAELDERYATFFYYLVETYTFFALTFGWKLDATSAELRRVLATVPGWDSSEASQAEIVLATPADLDEVSRERLAWLHLLHANRSSTELDPAIVLSHVREFPWLAFNTYEDKDVLDFFGVKYDQYRASGSDPADDIAAVLDGKRQLAEEQGRLLTRVGDQRANHLSSTLRWASQERLNLKWFWAGCEYLGRGMLGEISERIGISRHEFVHTYKRRDIARFLGSGERLPDDELQARLRRVSYLVTAQRLFCYSGADAERLEAELVDREPGVQTVLRGTPAFPGHATGPVKIIKVDDLRTLRDDFERFQEGDVLVTTMTQPNILMLMERASAVLTDEGGITSHAAVLCRELGIPCVIGLRNATTQLQQDELVTVDATAGTVVRTDTGQWLREPSPGRRVPRPVIKAAPPGGEPRPERVLWLHDVGLADISSVGGKAAALGELTGSFAVPSGFCVTTSGYRSFLAHSGVGRQLDIVLGGVDPRDLAALEAASEQIRRAVLDAPLPADLRAEIEGAYHRLRRQHVAVRSSSTSEDSGQTSFAGQHDSYLNVGGAASVVDAVKACWASLHTARAIGYRHAHELDHGAAAMSVLVQEMVNPEYAGVIFTVHPVTLEGLLLEIVEGLGDVLVSGERTPNRYVLSDSGDSILERFEGFDLSDTTVHRIASFGRDVALALHYAADIEFAVENDALLLLQSRPITTL
jgi:phosphohistidine swiveling domain-containing protein